MPRTSVPQSARDRTRDSRLDAIPDKPAAAGFPGRRGERLRAHRFSVHHFTPSPLTLSPDLSTLPRPMRHFPSIDVQRGRHRWRSLAARRLQAGGSNRGHAPRAELGLARSTPWKPAPGRNPVSDLGMPKNPAVRRPEAVLVTTRGSPQRLPAASPPPRDPRRIFE